MVSLEKISEVPDADVLPWLDRADTRMHPLTMIHRHWADDGVAIVPDLANSEAKENYFTVRSWLANQRGYQRGAHMDPCPYLYIPEIRKLCLDPSLMSILDDLIGYKMGLHLNLTGWVSTERNWHQDDYLNPAFVNSHYAAVWFALRDVDPDSGPFEYVPGSHKWPLTRREKVLELCPVKTNLADPEWPTKTQDWVSDIFDREIENRKASVNQFIGKEGDVLIWHGRLVHRGSMPKIYGTPRYSLIAHYSAIEKRPDMQNWRDNCFVPHGRESEWK